MPETTSDARLREELKAYIPTLATLYDRFAHSSDPHSSETSEAEKVFKSEVARWRDNFISAGFGADYGNDLPTFQKAIVRLCKLHIIATDKRSHMPK